MTYFLATGDDACDPANLKSLIEDGSAIVQLDDEQVRRRASAKEPSAAAAKTPRPAAPAPANPVPRADAQLHAGPWFDGALMVADTKDVKNGVGK